MSEEEKQAIEDIRGRVEEYEHYDMATFFTKDVRKLFEIVEKQQKEIEELKDITRAYDGMQGTMPEGHPIVIADKEYFDSGIFTEKFISKDKIKAKIKELEEKSKDSDNNVFLYGIYFYKELLEEGE